jgi:predicted nucleic acid-binding protein
VLVWWGTEVECASAVCRREREGVLPARLADRALRRLDALRARWDEVQPVGEIKHHARRLMRVHPLRAADSLQLAAALLAADFRPAALPFVTLDDRLARAAAREGLDVLAPS